MKNGKILALDQATTTGYAIAAYDGRIIESGIWKLADTKRSGESRGMRYVRFRLNMESVFERHPEINLICHEQTLLRGGAATEIANGLKALILEQAELRKTEVTCVHTSELKLFATGNGRADKEAMIESSKKHGNISPIDDNEADAVLIGLWASSKFGTFPAIFKPCVKKPVKKRRGKDVRDPLDGLF